MAKWYSKGRWFLANSSKIFALQIRWLISMWIATLDWNSLRNCFRKDLTRNGLAMTSEHRADSEEEEKKATN